jgi:predicted Rossmann fold nucleotide-binding protein DprA/Smf involved in DNA uptake
MRLEPRDDWVYWMLLAHYASTETRKRFWQERPDDVGQFLREQPDWDALQAHLVHEAMTLNLLCEQGGCLLTIADDAYPDALRQAQGLNPPLVLYALGDVGILTSRPGRAGRLAPRLRACPAGGATARRRTRAGGLPHHHGLRARGR